MSSADWMEILLFIACLLLISPFLGRYCYDVYAGHQTFISKRVGWLERLLYSWSGVDPEERMDWKQYLTALLLFNFLGLLLLFAILIFQHHLPWNPQHFPGMPWLLALNTAVSYVTNTDWQIYVAESTLSNFSQMVGLTVQNFLSAATGLTVFAALARGIAARSLTTIGNFWVDLVRSVVYILLPLSIVLSLFLVSQGVVQTLQPYIPVVTLEGEQQTIPVGPAASQVAIKQLGSNGGGYFHANSAHPFENPTRFSNFLQALSMLLIPAALPFTLGYIAKAHRTAWLLFLVMLSLWGVSLLSARMWESQTNPILSERSWLEGKEQRFGMTRSIVWFNASTVSANGSLNASEGSLKPLSIAIALFNMMHGEVAFGAVGVGVCGMIFYCILTSYFAAGLVGKNPVFLQKKIGKRDMQWVLVGIFGPAIVTLLGTAITCFVPQAVEGLASKGPHALTQLLYLFISTVVNNGSAFSDIKTGINYYSFVLSLTMILGRLATLVPVLAMAGSLTHKNKITSGPEMVSADTPTYAIFLFSLIVIVCLLIYLPALCLGPIVEHVLMEKGVV